MPSYTQFVASTTDDSKLSYDSRRSCTYGTQGMVSASQPAAAQAALRVLQSGGNAADAAVAAAVALAVTEPCHTGGQGLGREGGCGQWPITVVCVHVHVSILCSHVCVCVCVCVFVCKGKGKSGMHLGRPRYAALLPPNPAPSPSPPPAQLAASPTQPHPGAPPLHRRRRGPHNARASKQSRYPLPRPALNSLRRPLGPAAPHPGLGGDAFALFFDAKSKKVLGLAGNGAAPAGLSLEAVRAKGVQGGELPMFSALTVTVPGAARLWEDAVGRWGRSVCIVSVCTYVCVCVFMCVCVCGGWCTRACVNVRACVCVALSGCARVRVCAACVC
jgi:hypothetical protein